MQEHLFEIIEIYIFISIKTSDQFVQLQIYRGYMLSIIINLVGFCQISDIANENGKLPFQITLDIQMKISPLS